MVIGSSSQKRSPQATHLWRLLFCLSALLFASGCTSSSYLPSAKETIQSPWQDFNGVKVAFDQITPYTTGTEELHKLGFDPYATPNIKLLNYLDILQRFIPNQNFKIEDLDEGLQDCLADQPQCHAYEIDLHHIDQDRYGNVVLDVFNFRRKTKVTGWEFRAIIVMKDDTVVYKLWSGKPKIDENRDNKNPLGPIQGSEKILWYVVQ